MREEMGYVGYSMSERAAAAYDAGEMPASKMARRLNVSTAAVRGVMKPSSWHHTSKRYNRTDFYLIEDPDAEVPACVLIKKMREFDSARKQSGAMRKKLDAFGVKYFLTPDRTEVWGLISWVADSDLAKIYTRALADFATPEYSVAAAKYEAWRNSK